LVWLDIDLKEVLLVEDLFYSFAHSAVHPFGCAKVAAGFDV
jgi:hypothetical protein